MTTVAERLKTRWSKLVEPRHVDWTWGMLETLYTEPHRKYHNLTHVEACLELFDKVGVPHIGGPVVELALFFHDVVYVPGDKRNEELSANLLRTMTPVLPWTDTTIGQAYVAVLATQNHHTVRDDVCSQTVVDIDLSILGAAPYDYDQYTRAIRQEFAAVSDDAWRVGRARFLTEMTDRAPLYQTAWGRVRFGAQAHTNMLRELAVVEGRWDQ